MPFAAGDASAALDFSVVVPVYRGHATLDELCRRLAAHFEARDESFEVLLVDDGSRDGSWERITAIASADPRVIGLRLTRNFGQHNATVCGMRRARGALVVTLDEDLQNPPEEIAKLVDCLHASSADVVYGVPERRRSSWWRRLGSRVVMLVPRYVMQVDFDISSFRLLRRPIAAEVARVERHDVIIDVFLAWTTDRIAATRVRHDSSAGRTSSYTPRKLAQVLVNMLANYTVLPLRIASWVGALLSLLAGAAALYFVWARLTHNIVPPGFSALIVTLLFSTGVVLLGIGILSEYLARTFLHVVRKPQSVLRESTRDVGEEVSSRVER